MKKILLVLLATLVVAGGTWGLLADRDSHETVERAAAQVPTVAVPGGVLRLDGLADKTVGHVMTGMDMPDEVPPGMRRFAVDVTFAATGDDTIPYAERDFTVSGPGVEPVVPVRSDFDAGEVPAGKAMSGSITFDVPDDVTSVSIRFKDSDPLPVPPLPPVEPDEGHLMTPPTPSPTASSSPSAGTEGSPPATTPTEGEDHGHEDDGHDH